jgi:hypothetical protein
MITLFCILLAQVWHWWHHIVVASSSSFQYGFYMYQKVTAQNNTLPFAIDLVSDFKLFVTTTPMPHVFYY